MTTTSAVGSTENTDHIYVRVDPHLKRRVMAQCSRLGVSQAALTKMALIKLLEEEEKVQDKNKIIQRS